MAHLANQMFHSLHTTLSMPKRPIEEATTQPLLLLLRHCTRTCVVRKLLFAIPFVVATATVGLAALILILGRTALSVFKLPLATN